MKLSPRLVRARNRVIESAHRILEQKLRIGALHADGKDTSEAAKLLDEMKTVHRLLVDQLVSEEVRSV